jgi:CHAT domain-containing protein
MKLCWRVFVRRLPAGRAFLALAFLAAYTGPLKGQNDSYRISWKGGQDTLRVGVEPDDCFQECEKKKSSPETASCLQLVIAWGKGLVTYSGQPIEPDEARVSRGIRYFVHGYELLAADIRKVPSGPDLDRRLAFHARLDMGIHWLPDSIKGDYRARVLAAAANYDLEIWKADGVDPPTLARFAQKAAAGEELKKIFGEVPANSAQSVLARLDFYQAAFDFHQRVVPDVAGQDGATRLDADILIGPYEDQGMAYAVFPGETGLRPLSALARVDLERSRRLLKLAIANKWVTEEMAQSSNARIDEKERQLDISELKLWIDLLLKRGDRHAAAALMSELYKTYKGDLATAERIQEDLVALCAAIGDRKEWAAMVVQLADVRRALGKWQGIPELIEPVKQTLFETAQVELLSQALAIEDLARKALGQAAPSSEWNRKIEDVYKDAVTVTFFNDASAPGVQAKEISAWLAQPGHSEVFRLPAQMQLANALYSLHEYEQAEKLVELDIAQLENAKSKVKEFEAISVLLEIDSVRGNAGHFYATLDRYEKLGSDLYGEDWLRVEDGLQIAETLFRLHDFHRAERVLALHMANERREVLRSTSLWTSQDGVADQDLLLQARIDFELGRAETAAEKIDRFNQWATEVQSKKDKLQDRQRRLLLDLADMNAAVGKPEQALEQSRLALHALEPLQDVRLWVRGKLAEARAQLALGKDSTDDARKFEELAPQFTQYKELNAADAVEMESFLGDYYSARNDPGHAIGWWGKGLALADELGDLDPRIEIHRKLGEAAASAGDADKAIAEYRASVGLMRSISTAIPSDLGKVGYRNQRDKAVVLLAMGLYKKYEASRTPGYLQQMFQAVEEGKSRALTEAVFSRQDTSFVNLDLAKLQAALPPDGLLLEYYIPEGVSDSVLLFVLDRSRLTVRRLPVTATELARRVEELKQDATQSPDHAYDDGDFRRKARDLGGVLFPDGWDALEARPRRLFIVPAGVLYLFPFAMLADGKGRFLDESENIDIAYLPNAALLLKQAPTLSRAHGSAAFVNPGRVPDQSDFLANGPPELRSQFEQAFRAWDGGTVHWEEPFSSSEFLTEAAKAANVFIYSHGKFVPGDPTSSYVRFADEAGQSTILSAEDLINAKGKGVGSGLWVLAACSTGSGEVRPGDEVLGLPRALLEAGASMVVISLWDVDMGSSWQMMTSFYRNLAAGMPASRALHAAASALRAAGNPPFDWAPFILTGQHGFRD